MIVSDGLMIALRKFRCILLILLVLFSQLAVFQFVLTVKAQEPSLPSTVWSEFSTFSPYLVNYSDAYVYVTTFGNYSFKKPLVYLMNYTYRDGTRLVKYSMFWVNTIRWLMPLNPTVIVANDTTFQYQVDAYFLLEKKAVLTVTASFSEYVKPKISVEMAKTVGWTLGNFEIVWWILSPNTFLKENAKYTIDLKQYGSVSIVKTNVASVELGNVENPEDWKIWGLSTWEDYGNCTVYGGNYTLLGNSGTWIYVKFNVNDYLIDPSTVGTSTATTATSDSFQRKSFYANGRFWVFYSDGTNMVYYTSTDGSTWAAGGSSPIRASTSGEKFSIWFDGTYLHYAYASASSIYYRRGMPNSDGTITWSAVEQTVSTTYDTSYTPMISVDSNGYVWIGYRDYDSNTLIYLPYVIKSGNNDGTWGTTPSGFPYQLSTTSSSGWRVSIVPLTAGKMLVVYARSTATVRAKKWDGSAWGVEVATTSAIFLSPYYSAVAQGDDVHLTFLKSTGYDILYVKYTYSTNSFGTETTLQATATSYSAPVLSIDTATNNLYVFWAGYPTANHIYYRKYTASTSTWETAVDWITETALTSNNRLTCFYKDYGSKMGLVYMTGTTSPYNVRFAFLTSTQQYQRSAGQPMNLGQTVSKITSFSKTISQLLNLLRQVDRVGYLIKGILQLTNVIGSVQRVFLQSRSLLQPLQIFSPVSSFLSAFRSTRQPLNVVTQITRTFSVLKSVSQPLSLFAQISSIVSFSKSINQFLQVNHITLRIFSAVRSAFQMVNLNTLLSRTTSLFRIFNQPLNTITQVFRVTTIIRLTSQFISVISTFSKSLLSIRSPNQILSAFAQITRTMIVNKLISQLTKTFASVSKVLYKSVSISQLSKIYSSIAYMFTFQRTTPTTITAFTSLSKILSLEKVIGQISKIYTSISTNFAFFKTLALRTNVIFQILKQLASVRTTSQSMIMLPIISKSLFFNKAISQISTIFVQVLRNFFVIKSANQLLNIGSYLIRNGVFIKIQPQQFLIFNIVSRQTLFIKSISKSLLTMTQISRNTLFGKNVGQFMLINSQISRVYYVGKSFYQKITVALTVAKSAIFGKDISQLSKTFLQISRMSNLMIFVNQFSLIFGQTSRVFFISRNVLQQISITIATSKIIYQTKNINQLLQIFVSVFKGNVWFVQLNQRFYIMTQISGMFYTIKTVNQNILVRVVASKLSYTLKNVFQNINVDSGIVKFRYIFKSINQRFIAVTSLGRMLIASYFVSQRFFVNVSSLMSKSVLRNPIQKTCIVITISELKALQKTISQLSTVFSSVSSVSQVLGAISQKVLLPNQVSRSVAITKTLEKLIFIKIDVSRIFSVLASFQVRSNIFATITKSFYLYRTLNQYGIIFIQTSRIMYISKNIEQLFLIKQIILRIYGTSRSFVDTVNVFSVVSKGKIELQQISERILFISAISRTGFLGHIDINLNVIIVKRLVSTLVEIITPTYGGSHWVPEITIRWMKFRLAAVPVLKPNIIAFITSLNKVSPSFEINLKNERQEKTQVLVQYYIVHNNWNNQTEINIQAISGGERTYILDAFENKTDSIQFTMPILETLSFANEKYILVVRVTSEGKSTYLLYNFTIYRDSLFVQMIVAVTLIAIGFLVLKYRKKLIEIYKEISRDTEKYATRDRGASREKGSTKKSSSSKYVRSVR